MGWRAEADRRDFRDRGPDRRLFYHSASKEAFLTGMHAPEIEAEQEKLKWMDALIIQCPMWWFSMPAILKGWVDGVYARRFAYGVGYHGYERYGEGNLRGKRALLSMTIGPGKKSTIRPEACTATWTIYCFRSHMAFCITQEWMSFRRSYSTGQPHSHPTEDLLPMLTALALSAYSPTRLSHFVHRTAAITTNNSVSNTALRTAKAGSLFIV